jgi:PAS domain S-box-containing protein
MVISTVSPRCLRSQYGRNMLLEMCTNDETDRPSETSVWDVDALRKKLAEMESVLSVQKECQESDLEWFRRLADAAPFFIWMTSPDALCTFVNRAWLDLRGRKLSEELGNGWVEGLHPDDRNLCLELYLKSFSARQSYRLTCRVLRASGEHLWVEFAGSPYFDKNSTFLGYVIGGMDVTGRKRADFAPDADAVRQVLALTERERQILVLIAEGRSTKQAATHLGISYKTADSHRSRILEKLGVHETASMVRCAIRAGLIAP